MLSRNTEKYITFLVPLKKIKNDKIITCKIQFIDTFRFMSSSLSSLVDNFSEGLYNDKCTDLSLILNTYQPKIIE